MPRPGFRCVLCLCILLLTHSTPLKAAGITLNYYVYANGGYSLLKSPTVGHNDTGIEKQWGLGIYNSNKGGFDLSINNARNKINFTLGNAEVYYNFYDIRNSFRLPMGSYAGYDVILADYSIQSPEIPDVNLTGYGFGLHVGVDYPLIEKFKIYGEITNFYLVKVGDSLNNSRVSFSKPWEIKFGGKTMIAETELGLNVYTFMGFQVQKYDIKINNRKRQDEVTATMIGVELK